MAITHKNKLKNIERQIKYFEFKIQELRKEKEAVLEKIRENCKHDGKIIQYVIPGDWSETCDFLQRKCKKCERIEIVARKYVNGKPKPEVPFKILVPKNRRMLVEI